MRVKTKRRGCRVRQAVQGLDPEAALCCCVAPGKLHILGDAQFHILKFQEACMWVNGSTGCVTAGAAAISGQGQMLATLSPVPAEALEYSASGPGSMVPNLNLSLLLI